MRRFYKYILVEGTELGVPLIKDLIVSIISVKQLQVAVWRLLFLPQQQCSMELSNRHKDVV